MAHKDKIFNNSFDTPEFELGNISFELDPSVKNDLFLDLKSLTTLMI